MNELMYIGGATAIVMFLGTLIGTRILAGDQTSIGQPPSRGWNAVALIGTAGTLTGVILFVIGFVRRIFLAWFS